MTVILNEDDIVSRCIIFDRAFEQDLHIDELLWRFDSKDEDGIYHESAVLRRLAPDNDDVHEIGCGIAATQNVRKGNPDPGPKRRYYCGFRSANFSTLVLSGENYIVSFTNIPENESEAHVDVALSIYLPQEKKFKNQRASIRTRAGLALAENFGEAIPYRCSCDEDDEWHPFSRFGIGCLESGTRAIA